MKMMNGSQLVLDAPYFVIILYLAVMFHSTYNYKFVHVKPFLHLRMSFNSCFLMPSMSLNYLKGSL